jgi:hypothetical protein
MLATLYKARGVPTKQEVCAICVERSRGRTVRVHLGRGVSVWLCAGHASDEFRRRRGGRDFVLTLHRLWSAHGCLTKPRSRALDDHLKAMHSEPRAPRRRPGSYSWVALRREAEQRFFAGEQPMRVITELRARHSGEVARVPSVRTMRRWYFERRWLRQKAVAIVTGPGVPIDPSSGGQLADTPPTTRISPNAPAHPVQPPSRPPATPSASPTRHDEPRKPPQRPPPGLV